MSVHYASLPYQTFRTGGTGEVVATQKLIATGGEGEVFTLLGDQTRVAKIYNPHKRTTQQVRKLQVMLAHPPTDATRRLVPPHISLAWPIELLYDPGGSVAGFLMPRISPKFPQIWQIYSPPNRRQKYPNTNWKYLHHLALNLAVSFHSLHALGYVIGDVNAGNIHVDPIRALVTLVDTDSFQVKDPRSGRVFRSTVGTLEYTPPELRKVRSFRSVDRTAQCDLFGLGVLLFKLLMEGYHPFMGTPKNGRIALSGGVTLECIKRGIFPYAPSASFQPPVNAPPFSSLDLGVQDLLLRCFVEGYQDPTMRPTARTWIPVLERAERKLVQCAKDPRHWYSPHTPFCPWCLRQKRTPLLVKRATVAPAPPVPPTLPVPRDTHHLQGRKSGSSWYSFGFAAVLVVVLAIALLILR